MSPRHRIARHYWKLLEIVTCFRRNKVKDDNAHWNKFQDKSFIKVWLSVIRPRFWGNYSTASSQSGLLYVQVSRISPMSIVDGVYGMEFQCEGCRLIFIYDAKVSLLKSLGKSWNDANILHFSHFEFWMWCFIWKKILFKKRQCAWAVKDTNCPKNHFRDYCNYFSEFLS